MRCHTNRTRASRTGRAGVMLPSYDEIPHTKEGLDFYIDRANKAIKEYQFKINKLNANISEADSRLKAINNSPSIERMD